VRLGWPMSLDNLAGMLVDAKNLGMSSRKRLPLTLKILSRENECFREFSPVLNEKIKRALRCITTRGRGSRLIPVLPDVTTPSVLNAVNFLPVEITFDIEMA